MLTFYHIRIANYEQLIDHPKVTLKEKRTQRLTEREADREESLHL